MSDPETAAAALGRSKAKPTEKKARISSADVTSTRTKNPDDYRPITPDGADIAVALQSMAGKERKLQGRSALDKEPITDGMSQKSNEKAVSQSNLSDQQRSKLAQHAAAKYMTMNGDVPNSRACTII